MKSADALNLALCAALGIRVFEHKAMRRDGTFVQPFIKGAGGQPEALPDFEHDLNTTMARVPAHVQVIRRWSAVDQGWVYVFSDLSSGQLWSEGRDASEVRAAAKALLGWLQLEAAANATHIGY